MSFYRFCSLCSMGGWLLCSSASICQTSQNNSEDGNANSVPLISFAKPQPYQVVQRKGYVPQFAHAHQPGGAATGYADVAIEFSMPVTSASTVIDVDTVEFRTQLLAGMPGSPSDWQSLKFTFHNATVAATAKIDAGGWYQLDVRCLNNGQTVAVGSLRPFGVGELFLIAGQSYATNTNEQVLKVADAGQRVAAYNFRTEAWQVANDPQPTADQSDGGSLWPAFGDLLVSSLDVPIGLANVAYGGTSSAQWQPSGNLFPPLAETGRKLDSFRAVLWQQGESDVIGGVTVDDYVKNILTLRNAASSHWGANPPWLLAKSTLHPTVYNDPVGEGRIRQAIEKLILQPGFLRGPDTDILDGVNRGGPDSRRHFTGTGQRNAAALWFAAVISWIHQPRPIHEVMLRDLPELCLLEPAWNSPVVHRESSVLIQAASDQPAIARLAFEASTVLHVAVASSGQALLENDHWTLGEDRRSLVFSGNLPCEAIVQEQMFLPKDAPGSYRHRAGNPEQSLLYQPGRWFHDRNIEITYQRADIADSSNEVSNSNTDEPELLKRVIEKLKSGRGLHIGVSGDSISTGLDASFVTFASPFQLGYPELVAAQLQESFRCPVSLTNRAVAGWSVTHGLRDAEAMIAEQPDLMIIAYGMNDVGRRDPAWYAQQVRELVTTFQTRLPGTDIILVASMLGNSEWIHTPREMFALYRDELKKLTGPGIALADLTHVWATLLGNKHDLDLTGNGLNHPNDFGHRLYAQAILSLLVD